MGREPWYSVSVRAITGDFAVGSLNGYEIAVGGVLLAIPIVPPLLAGLSLLGFADGLNLLYLRAPGMRHEGSVKPTEMGIPIAKDFWMTAIGAALVLDSVLPPRR
jgi:hypothetical protein